MIDCSAANRTRTPHWPPGGQTSTPLPHFLVAAHPALWHETGPCRFVKRASTKYGLASFGFFPRSGLCLDPTVRLEVTGPVLDAAAALCRLLNLTATGLDL